MSNKTDQGITGAKEPSRWSPLWLSNKIWYTVLALIVSLVLITGASIFAMIKQGNDASEVVDGIYETTVHARDIEAWFYCFQAYSAVAMMSPDKADAAESAKFVPMIRNEFMRLVDEGDKSRLAKIEGWDTFKRAYDSYFEVLDNEIFPAFNAGKVPSPDAFSRLTKLKTEIGVSLNQLEDHADETAVTLRDNSRDVSSAVIFALALAAIIATIATTIPALRVTRSLRRSMNGMRPTVFAMAEGDFTVEPQVSGKGELAMITAALNDARLELSGIVTRMLESTYNVERTATNVQNHLKSVITQADQMSSQTSQVAKASRGVDMHVQTVAAGTEEMTSSIGEIASNAAAAAEVAASAEQAANAANDTVAKLGQSSLEIAEVVKAITAIAEQTNLLALNATIEAARAGEAGKGFAVVANEVKDLAQETSTATEDISARVKAIQADSASAVDAINEIVSVIQRINDAQGTIAAAVEEQTATTSEMSRSVSEAADGSSGIAESITEVATTSGQTKDVVTEAAAELDSLVQQARELAQGGARFKVALK